MKPSSTTELARVEAEAGNRPTTPENLEEKFDNGEDVLDYFDVENPVLADTDAVSVEIAFPTWIVATLDREAHRVGTTRDAVLKMWIVERIDEHLAAEAAFRP